MRQSTQGLAQRERAALSGRDGLVAAGRATREAQGEVDCLVPNPYEGTVKYATSVNQSNFNMPNVFNVFQDELFLVGINHAFVLNLEDNYRNFLTLAERLLQLDKSRRPRARFMISDMWNPSVFDCYRSLVQDPIPDRERTSFTAIFKTPSSNNYVEKVLARELGAAQLQRIIGRRLIDIRTYPTILDTFWFVDAKTGHGKGQLSPANASGGADRPFFFCGEDGHVHDPVHVFNYYYNLADTAFSNATRLWPNASDSRQD